MQSISGRIVTHDRDFLGTIYFDKETGLIQNVQAGESKGEIQFDPDSEIIFPGFGDIHIHAREDVSGKHTYKEDFVSAGNAAINGGVVQIADMPNNPVPPIDDSSYAAKQALTSKSKIHITLYAGIGPHTKPLQRNVPYKAFMGPSIGELFFKNNEELENTIQYYRGKDVSFHCEDPILLENAKGEKFHEDRRPVQAELTATDFALYLIEKYNLKGKLCHYSSGEGLDKIKKAKQRGLQVTCEVTPTHLFFDRSMLNEENRKWFQMNPPLREKSDREILLQALKEGWIDYLATDHAPHSIEEKLNGISGISQLDTYGLFVTHLILKEKISLHRIVEVCSKKPAEFITPYLDERFGKGFGQIQAGYSASFTVLNLQKETLFTKEMIQSKSGWSPFENYLFPGSISAVFYRGERLR